MAEGICCDINSNRTVIIGHRYKGDPEWYDGRPFVRRNNPLPGKCVARAAGMFIQTVTGERLPDNIMDYWVILAEGEPPVWIVENKLLEWSDGVGWQVRHPDYREKAFEPFHLDGAGYLLEEPTPKLVLLQADTGEDHLTFMDGQGVVDIYNPSDDPRGRRWFVDRWWSMCGCQPNK